MIRTKFEKLSLNVSILFLTSQLLINIKNQIKLYMRTFKNFAVAALCSINCSALQLASDEITAELDRLRQVEDKLNEKTVQFNDIADELNEMKEVKNLVQANEALTAENKSLQDQLAEAKKAISTCNGSDWLTCLSLVGRGRRFRTAVANQDSEATAPEHYIDPAYVETLMTDHAMMETIVLQGWQLGDVHTKADVLERLVFHQDLWNIIDCMLQDDPLATVIDDALVKRTLISMMKEPFKEKHLMDAIPSGKSNLQYLVRFAYGCNVEQDKKMQDSEMSLITENVDAVEEYMARNNNIDSDEDVDAEKRRILVEMGDHELDPCRPWRDRALVNEIQFRARVKKLTEFYKAIWGDVNHQAIADSIYTYAGNKYLVHQLMCTCFVKLDRFIEMHHDRTFKNGVRVQVVGRMLA